MANEKIQENEQISKELKYDNLSSKDEYNSDYGEELDENNDDL